MAFVRSCMLRCPKPLQARFPNQAPTPETSMRAILLLAGAAWIQTWGASLVGPVRDLRKWISARGYIGQKAPQKACRSKLVKWLKFDTQGNAGVHPSAAGGPGEGPMSLLGKLGQEAGTLLSSLPATLRAKSHAAPQFGNVRSFLVSVQAPRHYTSDAPNLCKHASTETNLKA